MCTCPSRKGINVFSRVRSLAVAGALSLAVTGLAVSTDSAALAAPTWAPAATADITPGVQTNTEGSGQCTANFVFTDAAGNVYLGQAAHCSGTGAATDTNG